MRSFLALYALVWLLATGPTLKETGDWINDTYNPRPGELSYKSHGVSYKLLKKNNIFETQDVRTTTLHIDGCVANTRRKTRTQLAFGSGTRIGQ